MQRATAIECQIRIASMLNKDYLFLLSDEEISREQAISELIPFLADDILMDQSSTEIITVHCNNLGQRIYRRFDIEWAETGPYLVRPKHRNAIVKIQYLETLLAYSSCMDDE
ncbi:hypothetical protein [Halioxenophilus sp. WMMB6]|uniref:hypothetical protein n=1 Tax=Halioxenophilus sp. WMMB6 TaxID=3073815 RepID=UPI00295E73FC|nr:hypothetical protein [Halioxenophilus sp. WMMB6]